MFKCKECGTRFDPGAVARCPECGSRYVHRVACLSQVTDDGVVAIDILQMVFGTRDINNIMADPVVVITRDLPDGGCPECGYVDHTEDMPCPNCN